MTFRTGQRVQHKKKDLEGTVMAGPQNHPHLVFVKWDTCGFIGSNRVEDVEAISYKAANLARRTFRRMRI